MGLHVTENGDGEVCDHNENTDETDKNVEQAKPVKTAAHLMLESFLNKNMKIEMTDGRVLVGIFLCTDRDRNVILGSCAEYLKLEEGETNEEPRVLGLAMVPGHHIVSIHVDCDPPSKSEVL